MVLASDHYVFKLHRQQKIVHQDNHRFRLVVAGRRWGKTNLSKTELMTRILGKEN